jgi:uncharacterized protein YlxW (UPF0749 family)
MTGDLDAGQGGQPAKASPGDSRAPGDRVALVWRVGTPLVVLLCGVLFVVSAVSSEGTDLRPGRYTDLPSLAEAERADYDDLLERRSDLESEVDDLTADVAGTGIDRLRNRMDELRDPAGLTPRSGEGVTVTLSDSPEDVFAAAAEDESLNLNLFVVHQQDIQAVVNAMWRGGASAVTIAGERVVSTTGIKCEGSLVLLQGAFYPQPYEISAVGDPDAIASALATDPIVSGYRANAADPRIQIGWSLEQESQLQAPAYDGLLDLDYAEPLT